MNDERELNDKAETPVKVLTADDIMAVEDINIVPVSVPEWGGTVYVKSMTALQREKYIESMRSVVIGPNGTQITKTVLRHANGKLAALTICDAKGNLLFERSPDVIEKLGQKSAKALERVADAASKLNGLDDEDERKKKAIERAKNVSAGQPDDAEGLNID